MARDDESLITNLDQDFATPIPFVSTTGNIEAVEYNKVTETLFVTFKNGKYAYFDVPEITAWGFRGASSATLYLNDQIKDVFDYEEV
jgi:hypothetical protein